MRFWRRWAVHNAIAHPISEALHWLGVIYGGDDRPGNWLHDATLPEHTSGTGRG